MIVGHTKFSPDWCFGLLKQRLRHCEYNCLDDIVREVELSADVNHAQLVGTQSGEILVPMYNWSSFFQPHFKPLPHLKRYHHFNFTRTCTGVTVKEFSDSDTTTINITTSNWAPSFSDLPNEITPIGLSEERKTYLYNHIREFCPEELRDTVFPPCTSINSTSIITELSNIYFLTSLDPTSISSSASYHTSKTGPYLLHLWGAWS